MKVHILTSLVVTHTQRLCLRRQGQGDPPIQMPRIPLRHSRQDHRQRPARDLRQGHERASEGEYHLHGDAGADDQTAAATTADEDEEHLVGQQQRDECKHRYGSNELT